MKALVCEMCGGHDLIKQDGLYVCQDCGTKYTVEEAKKMMVEGTVEVAGTVKVDSSGKLSNLYQLARRARDDNNNDMAETYYNRILEEDPSSWEAAFYAVYYTAMNCKIANIQSAEISVNNCIDSVFQLMKESVTDEEQLKNDYTEVYNRVIYIVNMLHNAAYNHYNGISAQIKSRYTQEYINRAVACYNTCYYLGDMLTKFFGEQETAKKLAAEAWKLGIAKHAGTAAYMNTASRQSAKNTIDAYAAKVKESEPDYTPPVVNTGGCYIATAVYGSYNCPQVWTLRRFRDYTLAPTWYGRAFIRTYYAVSPTLVRWFGKTKWFQSLWKPVLNNMVYKLNSLGVEDTPYEDLDYRGFKR